MINYKIYKVGNYIKVVNNNTKEIFNGLCKNVFIDSNNTGKNIYDISGIKNLEEKYLKLDNILKEDETPYTKEEWETFYTENTGNFNSGLAFNPQDYVTTQDAFIINNLVFTSKIIFCLNNNIQDLNLVILSDSTGDGYGEWAYLLTEYLATTYPNYTVNFRHWDVNNLEYQPVDLIQTGNIVSPKVLNIYLGGASGQGIAYGNTNFSTLFPITPDLVMISYGHNDNYANSQLYKTEYLKLTKRIRQTFLDCQIILLTQNPKATSEPTYTNGIRNANDIFLIAGQEGYGFVNVMQHFLDTANYETLLLDGIHPNTQGSELWASIIIKLFTRDNYYPIHLPRTKTETVFVPASSLSSSTHSLNYINKAGDVKIPTINLTDGSTNGVTSTITLPYDWQTINTYIYWTTDTDSSATNVHFNSYSYFLDSTVNAPVLGGGAFVISQGGLAGKINKTQIYSHLGSGEYALEVKNTPFSFSITRLGADTNDTYTGDCRVLGVLFERRL